MAYQHMEFSTLRSEHILGARLFATRNDLLAAFVGRRMNVVAEVGVAMGDFSEYIINTLRPKSFVAFDLFDMHESESHWNVPSAVLFNNMSHGAFYRQRMDALPCDVRTEVGRSEETLATYPDEFFDMIYLDGDHQFEGVRKDLVNAGQKIKRDGVIICNDYIMFDHIWSYAYGVVPAVNNFVATTDWKVVGFALQQHMFCDIALSRTKI